MSRIIMSYSKWALVSCGSVFALGFGILRKKNVSASATETTETLSSSDTQSEEDPSPDTLRLKGLIVFFRHGARTPLRHLVGIEQV